MKVCSKSFGLCKGRVSVKFHFNRITKAFKVTVQDPTPAANKQGNGHSDS